MSEGLDHLGIEVVSANLYRAMLPGITNVTERARYYGFYTWCIHRYAQDGPVERSRVNWVRWFRPLDFAYAVASVAHDEATEGDASAVVGAERARELVKGKSASASIDMRVATATNDKGQPEPDGYFKNPQGGFGQYYRGPMRELGLIRDHEQRVWPDVVLTNDSGRVLAECLDRQEGFRDLLNVARAGRATVGHLADIGSRIHPRRIESGSEEQMILRGLFLGGDSELARGQSPIELEWRRTSLRLMVDYLQRADGIERDPAYEFRWACLAGALPEGNRWAPPADLKPVREAWGIYQRNDILNYALECLMTVALQLLEDGPRSPRSLAQEIAGMSMEGVAPIDSHPRLAALPKRVSQVVQSAAQGPEAQSEPWGEQSTWQWVDRLEGAQAERDLEAMCGLAIRVLARLTTDRGTQQSEPFALFPGGSELAGAREIHLRQWWARVNKHRGDSSMDFIARLVLEWVVLRHIRVATGKLASQGVATYKFRPEGGLLVLSAAKLPSATFTSPRLRQGYRILEDVGYVARTSDGWGVTADGASMVKRA